MADDTSNEAEEQEEVEETEVSRDDDLDVELGPSTPVSAQSGGCRGTTAILFIVLLAIAAASIFYSVYLQRTRVEAAKAKAARLVSYQAKFAVVVKNVESAVGEAETGNVNRALELLQNAEGQLTLIGSEANQFNDQQWAGHAIRKKQFIIEAREAIASHQEVIRDQFSNLKSKFSNADLKGFDGPAAVETAPEEPAVEPAEPAEPVEPEAPDADVVLPDAADALAEPASVPLAEPATDLVEPPLPPE